jgi:hypothetical protein
MGAREIVRMGNDAAVLTPQVALVVYDHCVDERVSGTDLRLKEPKSIVGPLAQGVDTTHGILKWNTIFKDSSFTIRWTSKVPLIFSRCICRQTPWLESAVGFYKNLFGLDLVEEGKTLLN